VGRRISDQVPYQKGAIISREIARKDAGTVTVFAFDKGQGLSEHTAPFDAIVFILDGEAKITIAGRRRTALKGELIVMPAGKPHSLNALRRFKMMLIMIKSGS